jgi:acetolactate synthase-1/2/3 large subunit
MAEKINNAMDTKGPVLCEVSIPEGQEIIPRLVFTVKPDGKWISKPIEDMYPFLDRKEFKDNMIIDPLDED